MSAYRCFDRYLALYEQTLIEVSEVGTRLTQRMLSDTPDADLPSDLKRFYATLYSMPYSIVSVDEETGADTAWATVIRCLARDGVNQARIARWCEVSEPLVTKWKNGTQPGKYRWWRIALHVGLTPRQMPAFLMMAGYVIDPLCRQDTILLHGQAMGYSIIQIERQLEANHTKLL